MPRAGVVRADQHQLTRRGLRLAYGNLPCLAISGGYIRRLMQAEIFRRHQDKFPLEVISVEELRPGAFSKYAHRWGSWKSPGSSGRDSPRRRSGSSAELLKGQPPVSPPPATMPERTETQPAEQCSLASGCVAEIEPPTRENPDEVELPSDFYKTNPFRCTDEECFRCNDPKRVSCNNPERLGVAEQESKGEQAEEPSAGSGSGNKPEIKPDTEPVVMPKSDPGGWNPDNNGWDDAPQPIVTPEQDSREWNPNENSWEEAPQHVAVPEPEIRGGNSVPKKEDSPPNNEGPIPELRNFRIKTNPRPLYDMAELERMNPVNSTRSRRSRWRGASPRRSQGGFGTPRPRPHSPGFEERNPFSGRGFGNPDSRGFGIPSDVNEMEASASRVRAGSRNEARGTEIRHSGRKTQHTVEQLAHICEALVSCLQELRQDL